MLCPVRAVKIYLNKTKSLRKCRKRLFIPTQGDQDLAKPTLSRWVKYAIKNAYDTISYLRIHLRYLNPELMSSELFPPPGLI